MQAFDGTHEHLVLQANLTGFPNSGSSGNRTSNTGGTSSTSGTGAGTLRCRGHCWLFPALGGLAGCAHLLSSAGYGTGAGVGAAGVGAGAAGYGASRTGTTTTSNTTSSGMTGTGLSGTGTGIGTGAGVGGASSLTAAEKETKYLAEEQNRRNLEKMNLSGGTTTTEYSSTTATGAGLEGTASVSFHAHFSGSYITMSAG